MIQGLTYDFQEVSAKDDGYINSITCKDGIVFGCGMELETFVSQSNKQNVIINEGLFVSRGRYTAVKGSELVPVDINGTDYYGLLVYEINVNKTNTRTEFNQGEFKALLSLDGYPTPIQEDINRNGGIYQLPFATFKTRWNVGIREFHTLIGRAVIGGGGGGRTNLIDNAWFTIDQMKGHYCEEGTQVYSNKECTTPAEVVSQRYELFNGQIDGAGDFGYYLYSSATNPVTMRFVKLTDIKRGYIFHSKGWMDRWCYNVTASDNIVGVPTSEGLELTWSNENVGNGIFQILTDEVIEQIKGKQVTLSAIVNGEVYSGTMNVPEDVTTLTAWNPVFTANDWGFALFYNDSKLKFQFYTNKVFTKTVIRAVKLEIGSVGTLGNDTMPNYTDELLKCMRYMVRLAPFYSRVSATAKGGWYACQSYGLPVPMLTENLNDPTLKINTIAIQPNADGYAGTVYEDNGANVPVNVISASGFELSLFLGVYSSSLANKVIKFHTIVIFNKYSRPFNANQ